MAAPRKPDAPVRATIMTYGKGTTSQREGQGGALTASGTGSSLPGSVGDEASRNRMSFDSSHSAGGDPQRVKSPGEESKGPDAAEASKGAADSRSGSKSGSQSGGKSGSRAGSGQNTILGRMVVEQGLATSEEVQKAVESQGAGPGPEQSSLGDLLVQSGALTQRQLQRLRSQVEAERSGQQIPGYKILGKLGAGAMATVFKARQLSLDRTVAIKVLPRKFSQNAEFIARFYAEGRVAAQLNHPNIVQAYDVGQAGEFHYFVMEYVEGTTVHDQIAKHRRFSEADAMDIVIQIAEALDHSHRKGLIHRDVKPKNIMLTKEGVAKLADMGLARAVSDKEAAESEAGKAYGTPYYISPEQIRGEKDITPAADIYSLGATLYHMVTGSVPFEGKSPSAVMHKHLKAELVPPDHVNPKLSAGISQVIEMMMAKAASDRYQNCADLLTDLRAVRKGDAPVIARQDVAGMTLSSLAQAEQSAEGEIPKDKTRQPSAFSHPLVQLLVIIVILSILGNILLAAMALS